MAKGAKMTKKKKWIIFGAFAILVVLTTVAVLLATFLPIKPAKVYAALLDTVNVLPMNDNMDAYEGLALTEFKNKNSAYADELESYFSIRNGLRTAFITYSVALPQTISGGIERKQLKEINSSIAEGKAAVNNISAYLKTNLSKMSSHEGTIYTVVEAGWTSMRVDYAKALQAYTKALSGLAKMYSTNGTIGVFGNDMGHLVATSAAEYTDSIYEFLFGENKSPEKGKSVAAKFAKFIDNYFSIDLYHPETTENEYALIENYYINQNIQATCKLISDAKDKTFSTKGVIKNGVSLSNLEIASEELPIANNVLAFLNGEVRV